MSKELTLKTYDLAKPQEAVQMATVLKDFIVKQELYTKIQGKNYAHVDGWQFAGFLTGMNAVIEETLDLSADKIIKWKAVAKIYKGDVLISRGDAVCSSSEIKAGKQVRTDEYAILSMAQTRAIGKAFRNKIGWIMKLAGFASTPSEEMKKVDEHGTEPVIQVEEDMKGAKTCSVCDSVIREDEAKYSMKMFGRHLCRTHQKGAKRK